MNCTAVFNGYTFTETTAARIGMVGEHVVHSADLSDWLSFQCMVKKAIFITLINDDPKPSTATNAVFPGATGTLTVTLKGAGGGADRVISGTAMCVSTDLGDAHASVDSSNSSTFCLVSSTGTATPLSTNT